jgi:O-antigen ligase
MLVAVLLLLFLYRTSFPKWSTFALPLAIAVISLMLVSPRLASRDRRAGGVLQMQEVDIRIQLFERSLKMFADRPISGTGLGQFLPVSLNEYRGGAGVAEEVSEQTQHFHLVGMLVELGLLGLLPYIAVVLLVLRRTFRLMRVMPAAGFLGPNLMLTIAVIWLVYLTNNMFVEPSSFIFINSVPFTVGGMADGFYTQYMRGQVVPT